MSELANVPTEALQAALAQKQVESGRDAGIKGSFVSGFSSDETETVRYLASQLYPDQPLDQAIQRFGTKDGKIVHMGDDGKLYEALPGGWSPRGIAGRVASGAGAVLPAAAGTAAGIVTAPAAVTGVGLLGTVAAAGGAAAAGEVARQKVGDYMMGDASTNSVNPWPVVQEGVTGATGQGIGVAANSFLTRNAARDIAKYDPARTQQAYREAGREGIDITPAEATGLPSLGVQQKRLANMPQTSDQMGEFLGQRSEQVKGAWRTFLDGISPAADAEDVGLMTRAAARDVLSGLKREAQTAARPYYEAAYKQNIPFTTELEDLVKRPVMRDALMKAKELVMNDPDNPITKQFALDVAADGKKIVVNRIPTMEDYDLLKRGLDAVLESDAARNKFGDINSYGRVVQKLKSALVQQFDDNTKASYNPAYAQARKIYAGGAEDVSTAMESALNILANTKDVNVLSAAQHVFNPNTRSPQMVATLRNAIESKNPDAWQAVKRLYMQDITTDALRIAETGDILNPAGKIFKAFSHPEVSANLKAAMSPQEYGRMQELLAVMRRAASVPAMRSDTAWNQEVMALERSQSRPIISKIARNINPAQALRSVDEWMTESNMDKNAQKMVDIVTSGDPKAIEALKELRRIPTMTKDFVLVFGHLLSHGTVSGGKAILTPNTEVSPTYRPN